MGHSLYLKLGSNFAPVLSSACPLFGYVYSIKIEHFQETVICKKYGLAFGHFPELSVESLYGIGGINQLLDRIRVLEIG